MTLPVQNGPMDGLEFERDDAQVRQEYCERAIFEVEGDGVKGIYRVERDPWRLVWVEVLEPLD